MILSKSKLIAWRQCPKRLWLEVHKPEAREDSAGVTASFSAGNEVGEVARRIYDPQGHGTTLDPSQLGIAGLISQTQALLPDRRPLFEAGFRTSGTSAALSLADVLLPDGHDSWHMVEVKSSTGVKDYHIEDAAIQFYIATQAGLRVSRTSVAHVDSQWVYPGGENRHGLLREVDVTERVQSLQPEIPEWIASAHQVVADARQPETKIGAHCADPFACGFRGYCEEQVVAEKGPVQFPVQWLPDIRRKALQDHIAVNEVRSMEDVPDVLLNDQQQRVKRHTLQREVYFDREGSARALAAHPLPALFLDFETIAFAVPRWAGTRPYQQITFQYSLHRLDAAGMLTHTGFLDLEGTDPSRALARSLVGQCTGDGPVFAYNAGFEGARIREMAERFPELADGLLRIRDRLVDLLPITREHYYDPAQQGSWSIKKVLPSLSPDLRYDALEEVQDGGTAQQAYLEAIAPGASAERREQLHLQLWRYCELDTFAMVRLWEVLGAAGASDTKNRT